MTVRRPARAWTSVLGLAIGLTSAHATAAPTACAIRWDAWYTNGSSDPGAFTAATLSAPAWRARAPLHARFDEAGRIVWAPSQDTFDAEIRAAAKVHLCWVYLAYGDHGIIDLDHPMMRGLQFHRRSPIKGEVEYAVMTTPSLLIGGDRKAALAATLDLLSDSNYQRVEIGGASRPVLFIYVEASEAGRWRDQAPALRVQLDALRAASRSRDLGDPYVVVTLSGAGKAEALREAVGAEAISQYVAGQRRGHQRWSAFAPGIEADWNQYAATTSAGVVPTLRSGADIRARCQTPPPFEHRFPKGTKCDDYVDNPSPSELEQEFRDARAWVETHAAKDPAGLLLVYAWSECDESGNCLMPTYGDPEGRKLEAIRRALAR